TIMSDSEDSTVTYTAVSSPFEDESDIGSPRFDRPPIMPEDPYAYIMAAYQVPHAIWQSMEDTLSKFIGESAKRHEENSNLIKEIQTSTDAAIRNQGASIKTLEIQIGQMSKLIHARYAILDLPNTPYPLDKIVH
ncbi:hypothetical protein Tco_0203816, partial [Tanacetum coccineum]